MRIDLNTDSSSESSNGDLHMEISLDDNDDVFIANLTTDNPCTWKEAFKMDEAKKRYKALEDEYLVQLQNNTWRIVERPKNRKVIGSRFVFSIKKLRDQEKRKVRLVAKGCSQRPGDDFYEKYSPVVRSTSIILVAAISAELGLEIHQMAVVDAFLNGDLEEDVYI